MITTKQRAFLRGRANSIDTIIHIGKGGITENIVKQTDDALACREIVKGKCLETSLISAREAVQALAEACNADIVQTIGNKFVLYRPAKELKLSCRNLIGIFGGTFDPFHSGHLKALQHFSGKFDFEKILVVPTGIPPHKMQKSDVSADDRLEMTKRGVASVKNAEVWDFEIRNGGKSYTYLTLEEAARLYPGREFVFFAGSDMFLTIHCWKRPDKITKLAKLAVFSRTGDDFEALKQQKTFLEETYGAECFLFYEQPVAVSSTEIRSLLQTGNASAYLPAAVENYIKEKGLYRPREND